MQTYENTLNTVCFEGVKVSRMTNRIHHHKHWNPLIGFNQQTCSKLNFQTVQQNWGGFQTFPAGYIYIYIYIQFFTRNPNLRSKIVKPIGKPQTK